MSNKKESRGGKEWTTAYLISNRMFKYGYFECRMKIAETSGINNAFWLNCKKRTAESPAFEIDIIEGHYPYKVNNAIHNWGTKINKQHSSIGNKYLSKENLSKNYHIFGLYWDETVLQFYFDGRLIWEQKNEFCFNETDIRLSTAVLRWAGQVSDSIDGTDMRVDYVKVWQKKNQ